LKIKNTFPDGNFLYAFYSNKTLSLAIFKKENEELTLIKKTDKSNEINKWLYAFNLDEYSYEN